mgnify:CR=1 FL=1
MGDPESRGGFSSEMFRLRPSGYGGQKDGRKKYKRSEKTGNVIQLNLQIIVENPCICRGFLVQ